MNVETFNSLYPVGTPVFAYPGARPEDIPSARRLVTRTRTAAQLSPSGDPVVWVEGEGSYICLTHVDPVSEDAWRDAKEAEETSAAVAALPVPVGDEPQPLDDTRLAEALAAYKDHPDLGFACCSAHAVADHVPALQAEIQRLRAERHSTNEALSDAAEQLRANRDRIAELEAEREKLVRWHAEDGKAINRLVARVERRQAELVALRNDALSMRGSLALADGDRKVPFELGGTLTPAVDWLIARVAELEAARVLVCRECAAPVRWVENSNGGWWNHTKPVSDGHGVVPKPAEDPCHPCGCPKRFDRHAWGCPTLALAEETHVVVDDSSDPEHIDDCPGCETAQGGDVR